MKLLASTLFALALAAGPGAPAAAAPLVVSVTDAAGKPLEGAVVTVVVPGASFQAPPGSTAQVAQQGRQFAPQFTVVQVGTAITFPNLDTVRHHVYSFSPVKTFELKLYAGTPSAPIVFDKVGTAVLGCNIHDKMAAWIVVVDTPYFGKSDAAGQVRIDLPAGEHRMRAWHPQQDDGAAPVERMVHAGSSPVAVRLAYTPGAGP